MIPSQAGPVLMNSRVTYLGSVAIRLVLILTLIGLWILTHPEPSYACTCVPPDPPKEALAKSAVVFMGTAVSVREFERDDGLLRSTDPTTVEFNVRTVWKGTVSQPMFLTTRRWSESCGYPFVEGVTYVVYSRDGLTVSLCSRTRPFSEATDDLIELGQGQVPTSDTTTPKPEVSERQPVEPPTSTPVPSENQLPESPTSTAGMPEDQPAESPASGGCGRSTDTSDPSVVGLMAGIAWIALRRRSAGPP